MITKNLPTRKNANGVQKAESPSYPSVPTKFSLDSTPNKIIIRGNFYRTTEVAKIIGVKRQTVEYWRKQGLFVPDLVDHTGVFYYSIERVMQLKSVYHRNWQKAWATAVIKLLLHRK